MKTDSPRPSDSPPLSGAPGSEHPHDALAAKLICALSAETFYKSDCFDYLCWLEETHQSENVKGCKYLVLASDGTTCWGHTYADAVKVAMHHDKELYDAWKDLEMPEPEAPNDKVSHAADVI